MKKKKCEYCGNRFSGYVPDSVCIGCECILTQMKALESAFRNGGFSECSRSFWASRMVKVLAKPNVMCFVDKD